MKLRLAAGILVLAALIGFGLLLIPSYYRNWELQCVLEDTVAETASLTRPADLLKIDIAREAAEIGLPVSPGQVQVLQTPGRVALQADYFVRIDLAVYTVDLHFHPRASR
jgi:hypothetical protein